MNRDVSGPGRAPAGFALVETLIAALLLAVGTLAVATALGASWRAMEAAVQAQQAVERFADLAEELRSVAAGDRAATAAAWVRRSDAGSAVTAAPAVEGVVSWQARLEWADRELARPVRAAQSVGVAQ